MSEDASSSSTRPRRTAPPGRSGRELERRAQELGLAGRSVFSTAPGQLGGLAAEAVREGATLLVVVGGDGTVHEVVDGLMKAGLGTRVELAVLPRGTGKDFVRSMRIPGELRRGDRGREDGPRADDRRRARDATSTAPARPGEAYFANFAGAGISGAIAERANATTKAFGGKLSFLYATVLTFLRWKPARMSLTIDGEVRDVLLLEALAMNGDYTAGGMWMAPEAAPDDGGVRRRADRRLLEAGVRPHVPEDLQGAPRLAPQDRGDPRAGAARRGRSGRCRSSSTARRPGRRRCASRSCPPRCASASRPSAARRRGHQPGTAARYASYSAP